MNVQRIFTPGRRRIILTLLFTILSSICPAGFQKALIPVRAESLAGSQEEKPGVHSAIMDFEPALAVRGAGCITCHAKIYSSIITDFGYGSPYFFGNPGGESKVGPYNGSIYGDFIAGPGQTGWQTSEIHKEIIVPRAEFDFSLKNAAAEAGLAEQPSYQEALRADSLSRYLQALENRKPNPSAVIEKNKVFIGAPDTETLEARFGITSGTAVDFKYIKNDPRASADFKGIVLSENGGYYTNNSEIVCNGDVFIRGILFLHKPSFVTDTGCRIYTAGPIFLQNTVTYRPADNRADLANLQLVSTEAIFMGVGLEKCNTTEAADPLSSRLLLTPALPSIITRSMERENIPPKIFAQNLYNQAATLPLEDSSCHDETLSFSGILLNAPIVHSRYSGKFRGLIIAEFALFFQGKSSYEFDPVFKNVPVLPLLKDSDFLVVE